VSATDKFVDLKVKIMHKHKITPLYQLVCVDGRIIDAEGDTMLSDLNIKPGSYVYVTESEVPQGTIEEREEEQKQSEEIGFKGTKLLR